MHCTAGGMTYFEQNVLPLFEQHRANWLEQARGVARQIGLQQYHVTIDDVRELCPPPRDVDGRVMGAVFTRKEWQRVGYQASTRGTCYHRPVTVFKLKD